ncbi:MAG: DUF2752 domain-containing protein [Candidatus Hydrogenedentota bacterium]
MKIILKYKQDRELDIELIYTSIFIGLGMIILIFKKYFFYFSSLFICPFKTITSLPCPSCGMTRSFEQFINLNFISAFLYNPLFFFIYLFIVLFIVYSLIVLLFKLPRIRIVNITAQDSKIILSLFVVLIFAIWIYLIIMGF